MKKLIFKYQLETTDIQSVLMPKNAEILCVQTQKETPCLWAMIEAGEERNEYRAIEIRGTGHIFKDDINRKYIGTYQLMNGNFVGHVFERIS